MYYLFIDGLATINQSTLLHTHMQITYVSVNLDGKLLRILRQMTFVSVPLRSYYITEKVSY